MDTEESIFGADIDALFNELGEDNQALQGKGSNGWSTADIYQTPNGRPVIIPQHTHYFYRGEELNNFNIDEYTMSIEVIIKPKKKSKKSMDVNEELHYDDNNELDDSSPTKRRNCNNIYLFDKAHPLYSTHCQRLTCKQRLSILTGRRPPTLKCLDGLGDNYYYSNCNKATRSQLDAAALYF